MEWYELHVKDRIWTFSTLEETKKVSKLLKEAWVIFKFVQSKLPEAIKEIDRYGELGFQKVMYDLEKGCTITELSKRYHIAYTTLRNRILEYRRKHDI